LLIAQNRGLARPRNLLRFVHGGHPGETPADPKQDIAIGEIWTGGLFGGNRMAVVAIEADTIYVKRADSPTENLRLGKGAAYPTHRLEFANMTLLDERWTHDDEVTTGGNDPDE
jgi:hypothetical protein